VFEGQLAFGLKPGRGDGQPPRDANANLRLCEALLQRSHSDTGAGCERAGQKVLVPTRVTWGDISGCQSPEGAADHRNEGPGLPHVWKRLALIGGAIAKLNSDQARHGAFRALSHPLDTQRDDSSTEKEKKSNGHTRVSAACVSLCRSQLTPTQPETRSRAHGRIAGTLFVIPPKCGI
jgi:hypothetical protein